MRLITQRDSSRSFTACCGTSSISPRTGGVACDKHSCCRFRCRLTTTLSGIAKDEQRQITLSVNDLTISCLNAR